jgi:FkbM family methyltransferase
MAEDATRGTGAKDATLSTVAAAVSEHPNRARLKASHFDLAGERYSYQTDPRAWKNERAVELPIAYAALLRHSREHGGTGAVIEVGNVLSHYYPVEHDVVDKYESDARVTWREDVIDFRPPYAPSLVLSISTLEHVGFSESPRDPARFALAIETIVAWLAPGGRLLFTVPIGYNPAVAALLARPPAYIASIRCLRRTSAGNLWEEADFEAVRDARYDDPYPCANAVAIVEAAHPTRATVQSEDDGMRLAILPELATQRRSASLRLRARAPEIDRTLLPAERDAGAQLPVDQSVLEQWSEAGRLQELAAVLRAALASEPESADLHYRLAHVLLRLGESDGAGQLQAAAQEHERRLQQKEVERRTQRREQYQHLQVDAQRKAEQIAQHPEDPSLHHQLAWLLAATDRPHEAVQAQRRACALEPANWLFAQALGKHLAVAGKADAAREAFVQAQALLRDDFARFMRQQRRRSAAYRASIRSLAQICGALSNFLDIPGIDRAERLLDEQVIDAVAGWDSYMPRLFDSGEVASVPEVGRFAITQPEQVLHKRLARGIAWEAPLAALLAELAARCDPGALIVEVGASIGVHTVLMARHHRGTVVAFEPLQDSYRELLANLRLNHISNVVALDLACSDADGRGHMIVEHERNPGMAWLQRSAQGDVSVTTLAQRLEQIDRPLGIVKIDAQGHEDRVLAGAEALLRAHRPPIVCGLSEEAAAPVVGRLGQLGYSGEPFFRHDWVFMPA